MAKNAEVIAELQRRLETRLVERLDANGLRLVREAVAVAKHAHAGQVRDDGSPYLQHPLRAALILAEELDLFDPELLAAALLHDVLEDAPALGPSDLQQRFGHDVTRTVSAVTKEPRRGRSREEATSAYYATLVKAPDAARLVKLADKLDNVRDVVTSPHQGKGDRTAGDARKLFSLLTPLLADRCLATRLHRLLGDALLRLERARAD